MSLSSAEIRNIVETLQESGWDQAVVVVGDVQISVARNGAALAGSAPLTAPPAAIPAPSTQVAPPAPAEAAPSQVTGLPVANAISAIDSISARDAIAGHVVEAPSVGVFWAASEPGAAPFVSLGQIVKPGDTLCIIEIMKLMNNVTSSVAGEVVAIHATNSAAVEYGTPLFTIRLKD